MTDAVFEATYSDWKVIKGRKVVQVVLEIPLEKADLAYQVLGGMPIAAHERWCAVARLDKNSQRPSVPATPAERPQPDPPPLPAGATNRKSWDQLPPAQQAAIRCQDLVFGAFLRETGKLETIGRTDSIAAFVRSHCGVESRSEIRPGTAAAVRWADLDTEFREWQAMDRMVS